MKTHHLSAILLAASPLVSMAADCAPQPGCQVPTACNPPVCYNPPQDRSAPPPGNYVRGPATGEAIGESNGIGIRGFGIRIPEINLRMPSIELPSLYSFRRGPEMRFDGGRGPYVEGEPAEFRMVEVDEPRTAPPPETPSTKNTCAPIPGVLPADDDKPDAQAPVKSNPAVPPPAPATAGAYDELRQRELELLQLRRQVAEMQEQLGKLAATQESPTTAARPVTVRQRISPAAFTEESDLFTEPALPAVPAALPRPNLAPPPSRPSRFTPTTKDLERESFGSWSSRTER